jgi:dTDP-4-amino-4,6-dideoxygalactose transaminase
VHTPLHRLQHLAGFALTERAWKQSVSIPIHPSLSDAEVGRIIDVVSRLLQAP